MAMTVITYGGGEILKNIFESVAMLLNSHSGSLIKPLLMITISVGAIWAACKAFFTNSHQALLTQFLLPILVITGLLLVPSGSVHIEDVLKHRAYKVDHVPLMVARFAELASTIGYKITGAVEKVMHVPNDLSYNATGMVFGADTALDISRYRISNANLDQNLRRFCKQCVMYDVSLGRYTIDDLKKSTDLWKLFEQKTSKVGMMTYLPIEGKGRRQPEYLSCRNAIKRMKPYLEKEKNYFGQLDVIKNLPLTFQALTGIQKEKEELISQQLVLNLLGSEFEKKSFATNRAASQQRSTYQILGSLASSSLVTLRAVIEALIYASCIFILPLSVLPGGIKYLMTWAGLVMWIQMWPPFYAILNYIMQSVAVGYADTIFHGLSGAEQGLSLFTSIGLNNLQEDVYALSGYLAASIPFITYAILKGGVGSFIHLAGSMMTPAHSAATTAAAEQTTGNYSFGNASMGQMSYQNSSAFQTNTAPSLSSGYFQENRGDHSVTYGADEQILKQNSSDLRASFFSDESVSQTMQQAKMKATSNAETAQNNFLESTNAHTSTKADLAEYLANSDNYTEGASHKEAYAAQDSARFMQNLAKNWAKQEGIDYRTAMEEVMGGNWNIGLLLRGQSSMGASKNEQLSGGENTATQEEYQKHYQRLQDFSQSSAANSLDERGQRLTHGYSQSLDRMQSAQESHQIAQTELNQISENATWSEQNSDSVKRSLNQDFIGWASEQYADQGGFGYVKSTLISGNSEEKNAMVNGFVTHLRSRREPISAPKNFVDPSEARSLPKKFSAAAVEDSVNSFFNDKKENFSNDLDEKRAGVYEKFQGAASTTSEKIDQTSQRVNEKQNELSENFNKSSKKSVARHFAEQHFKSAKQIVDDAPKATRSLMKTIGSPSEYAMDKVSSVYSGVRQAASKLKGFMAEHGESTKQLGNNFQMKEAPFWMSKKEKK